MSAFGRNSKVVNVKNLPGSVCQHVPGHVPPAGDEQQFLSREQALVRGGGVLTGYQQVCEPIRWDDRDLSAYKWEVQRVRP